MKSPIQDKTVLVTGANRGIGKAITEHLLEQGARKVYAAVRKPDSAKPLVQTHGDRVEIIHLDLNAPASIKMAATLAGDVEVVINNAAILENSSPLNEQSVELWQQQSKVNVEGLLHVAQAFAPVLKANGGGAFVQINSSAALRCSARFSIYAATKAAAYLICQGLREEFSQQHTHMVSVHPGPILTDMAIKADIAEDACPPEVVAEGILKALEEKSFLIFPGKTAQKVGEAYAPFAEAYIHEQ